MPVVSPNEIESAVKRAVRGAGFAWGLAEDMAKAVRWLETRGAPGLTVLADHLEMIEGLDSQAMAVVIEGQRWCPAGGFLSPVLAGPALSDAAAVVAASEAFTLTRVAAPLLLAPFAAAVSEVTRQPVRMAWPNAELECANGTVRCDTSLATLASPAPGDVRITLAQSPGQARVLATSQAGIAVDPALWKRLSVFVGRTYVPASALSRSKGAGAGSIDND